ncbi:MAG TPA: tetratricopeptide repeat protein [Thermoanaerobaculia bacterium]|nr:tetratricopeptide repeat protein [Thermoanaerobaculia bacterium]
MPRIHPQPDSARRLAACLSDDEKKMIRHALSCPTCSDTLLGLLENRKDTHALARVLAWPGREAATDYATAIDEVIVRCHSRLSAIAQEQAEAPALAAELLRHPPSRREVLISNGDRFVSLAVVDQLLRASRELGHGDPQSGEAVAVTALALTDRLSQESVVAPSLLADTRARCHLAIGNARRIATDLRGSDEAIATAEDLLRDGTHDRLERARLYQYKASLRCSQRRFTEAASLLDRAIAIYRQSEERHQAGEAIVARAFVEREMGFPERAIQLLREAGRLIDPKVDPRLTLCLHHNLIDLLTDVGRAIEAQGLMSRSGEIYSQFTDTPTRLRRLWVQGKIARGLGQLEDAARLFDQVRVGFGEAGIGYDAALAALDLAGVSAQLGRTAEVRRLAEEMLPIFRSRDVHREAIAALIVFQRAAADEQASLSFVEELSSYLRHSAQRPSLPLEPSR